MTRPPPPALQHVAGHRARAQERAANVDPLYRVPQVHLQLHHRHPVPSGKRAGVVHQDVDAAHLLERLGHHAVHLLRVADIRHHCCGTAAQRFDLGDCRVETAPLGVGVGARDDVIDHHVRPLRGQAPGDRVTDSMFSTGAGDQRHLTLQVVHQLSFAPRAVARRDGCGVGSLRQPHRHATLPAPVTGVNYRPALRGARSDLRPAGELYAWDATCKRRPRRGGPTFSG